jgi:hypothetical protein
MTIPEILYAKTDLPACKGSSQKRLDRNQHDKGR